MVPKLLVAFWEKTKPLYLPLSWLYGLGMWGRIKAYEAGWLPRRKPGVPSIVVGNLSLGGEGKTPFTLALAELLKGLELKPVVILRGYGGRVRGPRVVSEGEGPILGVEEAGEEALLYALRLPRVPVVVGKDRLAAAELAYKKFRPGILLFDDAFQHLRLRPELCFLVLSAGRDPFSERLFPAGRLREPVSAARRAQAIFLTRANQFPEQAKVLARRFSDLGLPVFEVSFEPGPLVTLTSLGFRPCAGRKPHQVVAFCGLGDPVSFRKSLEEEGFEVLFFKAYPDHYRYRERDIRKLSQKAVSLGAEALITTEKDLLKVPKGVSSLPVWAQSLLVRFPRKTIDYLLSMFLNPSGLSREGNLAR